MSRAQIALRFLRNGFSRCTANAAVASGASRSGHQLLNVVRRISTEGLPIDSEHTAKWMTNYKIKSPMELIAEIPPVEICPGSWFSRAPLERL
ncbi:hypothetical protein R1sor_007703 [Riccia sorocarpa]|uniref:Uncharacterized protein n=1 Tax=Riccia sorocarpa TaxID=122646 RepID=A0ABD3HR89_9MARC